MAPITKVEAELGIGLLVIQSNWDQHGLIWNIGSLQQQNREGMQNSITQIGNFSYYSSKPVGQGATGLVYLGFRNFDKQPVAVKAIKLQDVNTPVKRHLLDCEVAALLTVKNKYVCQAYDVLKDGQFYYVPMEYCPNGTLRQYIKAKGKLSETQSLQLFAKILQGYCAIRQGGFIHRDLKTQNVLLRANMEPAIIDFGYCEKVETQSKNLAYNVGSPAYMSPEAYNESFYSEKSDIWALGVMLHEMVTGTIPVMRTSDVDEYFRYLKNLKTAEIVRGGQSDQCNRIILSALTVDYRLRPNAQQLRTLLHSLQASSPIKSENYLNRNQQAGSPSKTTKSFNRINSNVEISHKFTQPIQTQQQQQNYNNNNNNNNNKFYSFIPKQYIALHPNQPHQPHQSNQQTAQEIDMVKIDSPSIKRYANQQPSSPLLRQTMPSQQSNFMNLRKRIQSNANNNFNLNLTPVRSNHNITTGGTYLLENIQSPYLTPHKTRYEPMTPTLESRNYKQEGSGAQMKKSNSFSHLNIQARRF